MRQRTMTFNFVRRHPAEFGICCHSAMTNKTARTAWAVLAHEAPCHTPVIA
ncbi:hypothetical protein [Marinobacter salarius]|uniref:hypothetical protein n=1 Tax=Marinobacter salarius TaxID=1420917 RepID=UPI0032EBF8A6